MEQDNTNDSVPIAQGGGSLDLTTDADRALVHKAMVRWPKRWRGLSESFKERCVRDLEWAAEQARLANDPLEGAKVLTSVAKVAVQMEAQQQADEHLADKNARLDAGLATERLAVAPELRVQGLPDDD